MASFLKTYAVAALILTMTTWADTSYDLSELVVVAGDNDFMTNLTEDALRALGWQRGVIINFNMDMPNSHDQAMTFMKDDHCIAVFQGISDSLDLAQVIGGFNVLSIPPVEMCNHSVHAGVAQEFGSFLQTPEYGQFVAFLNDPRCLTVTSVGHSFGGALATLFATCANIGAEIGGQAVFGPRKDYGLTTFAPVAMATTPPFNRQPRTPFVGTRYGVTEIDGGASYHTGFKADTKDFRLELLDLYSKTAAIGMNMTELSEGLMTTKGQISGLTTDQLEAFWEANIAPQSWVQPLSLYIFQVALQNTDTELGQMIAAATGKWAASGLLTFENDMVSSVGQIFGFKHALQDFQALPNKLFELPGRTFSKVLAASAVELPKADAFQFVFGTLANGGGFQNHDTCCYASKSNEDCAADYTTPEWRSCKNPLIAYMSATTCGDIKASYRKQGCCGNPSKTFQFSRRLGSVADQQEDAKLLMSEIDLALRTAKAKGGKEAARSLAKKISAILP